MSRIDDPIEEFKFNYGKDYFNELIKQGTINMDLDTLASDIVDTDGVANSLSRYDGEEVETDFDGITYYMYRNN